MTGWNTITKLTILLLCGLLAALAARAQEATRASALAFEQAGRTSEAVQVWTVLATADPRDAEARAHLGLLEARQEHYDAAIEDYKQALALRPDTPGLELNLGLACFKAGKFPAALKSFRVAQKQHPEDTRVALLLGMTHYGMSDYLVAIPYLQQAAARDPQNLALRLTLAHSCLWSKQYACVMDTYKEILALNAESAEADMLAGEALDEEGNDAGAMTQLRAAIRANSAEPNAHFGLGYLLWKQSHFAEAATEFQAELANDHGHVQAQLYLADALIGAEDYVHAEPELQRAAQVGEGSAMFHRDLGALYAHKGRDADAIREFERAIALDPADSGAHWRLARIYQATGKRDLASAEFAMVSKMIKEAAQPLAQKLASGAAAP